MAENPATWGHAERVVYTVIRDHDENMRKLSLVALITAALRREGLLAPAGKTIHPYCTEHDQPLSWCTSSRCQIRLRSEHQLEQERHTVPGAHEADRG